MARLIHPTTTRMALKYDPFHSTRPHNLCYDIYTAHRFLWFFWTPFIDIHEFVFAKCKGDAWKQAYVKVYGDLWYGPQSKKEKTWLD